ncbi:MAG: hypothetical protein ACRD2N_23755 [Vicinamibacterales bacterium]
MPGPHRESLGGFQVTVLFRTDDKLKIWVPSQMDEYYKATQSLDEIFATATYSNMRKYDTRAPGR